MSEISNIKRFIHIKFQKEGLHRYPAAETDPNLSDVSYLAQEHFHYFYFYVGIEVFHNDRCIEFQQFRRWCEKQYQDNILKIDYKSCEMLAEDLIGLIKEQYPDRDINVKVYEDDINGAELIYSSKK